MTDWKKEWKPLFWIVAGFLAFYFLPTTHTRFQNALFEALELAKWYAREHVVLCLLPAFFIAGAIAVFVNRASILRYLGPTANKLMAYGVASVSGTILAVCSCTVLPLFGGIRKMGAGLGPACSFLYSGPAINVMAIILTARILGLDLGIARAVGAVVFSIIIGLLMHALFRHEERRNAQTAQMAPTQDRTRPGWQTLCFFAALIFILIFANWGKPQTTQGVWYMIYHVKWLITAAAALALAVILVFIMKVRWWKIVAASIPTVGLALAFPSYPQAAFAAGIVGLGVVTSLDRGETGEWFNSTWDFAKQIMPLLLLGVLVAGFFLGRPEHEGIIPSHWVSAAVGGNSIISNLFASVAGAFMYFATLTEVPIVQGLLGAGMGKGPALTLLLAGPALSLPSMLVLRTIIGTKKTAVFVLLVIAMSTITGYVFGLFVH